MIALVIVVVLIIVSIKYLSCWIGLCALVRWMESNKMPQPSDSEMRELVKWVGLNIWKDIKRPGKKRLRR